MEKRRAGQAQAKKASKSSKPSHKVETQVQVPKVDRSRGEGKAPKAAKPTHAHNEEARTGVEEAPCTSGRDAGAPVEAEAGGSDRRQKQRERKIKQQLRQAQEQGGVGEAVAGGAIGPSVAAPQKEAGGQVGSEGKKAVKSNGGADGQQQPQDPPKKQKQVKTKGERSGAGDVAVDPAAARAASYGPLKLKKADGHDAGGGGEKKKSGDGLGAVKQGGVVKKIKGPKTGGNGPPDDGLTPAQRKNLKRREKKRAGKEE
jgi:hypothetical protein